MNTANQPTSTSSSESCNTMGGEGQGGQGADVTRAPWWDEVGRLVDAYEAELAAAAVSKTGAGTTHQSVSPL